MKLCGRRWKTPGSGQIIATIILDSSIAPSGEICLKVFSDDFIISILLIEFNGIVAVFINPYRMCKLFSSILNGSLDKDLDNPSRMNPL